MKCSPSIVGAMRILRQIRLELPLVSTMQLISVLIYMVIHVHKLCHLALEHNLEHFMSLFSSLTLWRFYR